MGIEAFGLRPSHPLCYAMLCYAGGVKFDGRRGTSSHSFSNVGTVMSCSTQFGVNFKCEVSIHTALLAVLTANALQGSI